MVRDSVGTTVDQALGRRVELHRVVRAARVAVRAHSKAAVRARVQESPHPRRASNVEGRRASVARLIRKP